MARFKHGFLLSGYTRRGFPFARATTEVQEHQSPSVQAREEKNKSQRGSSYVESWGSDSDAVWDPDAVCSKSMTGRFGPFFHPPGLFLSVAGLTWRGRVGHNWNAPFKGDARRGAKQGIGEQRGTCRSLQTPGPISPGSR